MPAHQPNQDVPPTTTLLHTALNAECEDGQSSPSNVAPVNAFVLSYYISLLICLYQIYSIRDTFPAFRKQGIK